MRISWREVRFAVIGLVILAAGFVGIGLLEKTLPTAQAGEAQERIQRQTRVGSAKLPVEYLVHRVMLSDIKAQAKEKKQFVFCSTSDLFICLFEGELYVRDGDKTPVMLGEKGDIPIGVGPNGEIELYLRRNQQWYDDLQWSRIPECAIKATDIVLVDYAFQDEEATETRK